MLLLLVMASTIAFFGVSVDCTEPLSSPLSKRSRSPGRRHLSESDAKIISSPPSNRVVEGNIDVRAKLLDLCKPDGLPCVESSAQEHQQFYLKMRSLAKILATATLQGILTLPSASPEREFLWAIGQLEADRKSCSVPSCDLCAFNDFLHRLYKIVGPLISRIGNDFGWLSVQVFDKMEANVGQCILRALSELLLGAITSTLTIPNGLKVEPVATTRLLETLLDGLDATQALGISRWVWTILRELEEHKLLSSVHGLLDSAISLALKYLRAQLPDSLKAHALSIDNGTVLLEGGPIVPRSGYYPEFTRQTLEENWSMAETEIGLLKLDVEAAVRKLEFQAEVLQRLGPDLCSPGYLQNSIVLKPRFDRVYALLAQLRLQCGAAEDPEIGDDALWHFRHEYQTQLGILVDACWPVNWLSESFVSNQKSLVAFVKSQAPSFVREHVFEQHPKRACGDGPPTSSSQ